MKVLIVSGFRYNGSELWTTLGMLQEAGIEFEIISTQLHIQDELTGQISNIKRTINDVEIEELEQFDGLISMSGVAKDIKVLWTNEKVLALVQKAKELDLAIAAICMGVTTIREAAKGKRVSFYPLFESRQLLEKAGAICSSSSISVDNKIVTAENQALAQLWIEYFIKVLQGEEVQLNLQKVDPLFTRNLKERKLHPRLEKMRGTDTSYRNRKNKLA